MVNPNNIYTQAIQRLQDFRKMYDYESRLRTFADWPFTENCKCTPENMAKAGFVHCPTENEPDIACCFFCLKELEGWEPDDDPKIEHSKRSADCGFLALSKSITNLSMEAFIRLEVERIKCFYRKFYTIVMHNMEEEMTATTKSLLEHFSKQHGCSIDLEPEI
ncbi:baculoviral IAP repeat-containing protein 5.1-like [Spea bombifrons]|uniref:baculoviral IAP repeat-containing protein 5.1-like n=1 Tax=Spea bombifrons TaxID=233779 RepID=UPI00234BEF3B|nr:baculoviral IAP repeat-containing protein 5.1-like [Spea bombifrons]